MFAKPLILSPQDKFGRVAMLFTRGLYPGVNICNTFKKKLFSVGLFFVS